MHNILNHFKFQSVKKVNRLSRHPIFCYDFIIGLAMLMLMINVLTLLTIHKPLVLFGLAGHSFSLLFPIGLTCSNIIASVYGYAIARNMAWWFIITSVILFSALLAAVQTPHFQHNRGHQLILGNMSVIFIAGILNIIDGITLNKTDIFAFANDQDLGKR